MVADPAYESPERGDGMSYSPCTDVACYMEAVGYVEIAGRYEN